MSKKSLFAPFVKGEHLPRVSLPTPWMRPFLNPNIYLFIYFACSHCVLRPLCVPTGGGALFTPLKREKIGTEATLLMCVSTNCRVHTPLFLLFRIV